MTEQLISFEVAKLAKEKGFDIACVEAFGPSGLSFRVGEFDLVEWGHLMVQRPTQSLLQKWLRDVHGIQIDVTSECKVRGYRYDVSVFQLNEEVFYESLFNYYEEALEAGLLEALKLL